MFSHPDTWLAHTTTLRDATSHGVHRPSPRAVRGVFEWIDQAHACQRTWARNALVVVLVLTAVLCAALQFGIVH